MDLCSGMKDSDPSSAVKNLTLEKQEKWMIKFNIKDDFELQEHQSEKVVFGEQ